MIKNNDKYIISSKAIDLAEDEKDDRYITLTNRLCYYDMPNANNVILPSDTAEEKAKSLIDMPVVGKYQKDFLGQDNLGGHELSFDEDGEPVWGTEIIGVHKSVEVKDDTVNVENADGSITTKTLPCLFATSKIYTRNRNVVNAIKRLYDADELYTSWEIQTKSYNYEDGYKTLTDYLFDSNCVLGSYCTPAYGKASKTLDISTKTQNCEMMIAEAISKDISAKGVNEMPVDNKSEIDKIDEKEITEEATKTVEETIETPIEETEEETSKCGDKDKDKEDKSETENSEIVEETSEETVEIETETSELTTHDIREKIGRAIDKTIKDIYYTEYIFPLKNYALCKGNDIDKELDFIKVNFTVDENGEVTVDTNTEKITLTCDLSETETVISEKNEAIIKANEKIKELSEQIEKLSPFKDAYEKAEKERIEKELSEKRETLKSTLINSELFTQAEIDSEEIATLLENVNETGIKNLIADRFIASVVSTKKSESVETSETSEKTNSVKADINSDDDEESFSVRQLFA